MKAKKGIIFQTRGAGVLEQKHRETQTKGWFQENVQIAVGEKRQSGSSQRIIASVGENAKGPQYVVVSSLPYPYY